MNVMLPHCCSNKIERISSPPIVFLFPFSQPRTKKESGLFNNLLVFDDDYYFMVFYDIATYIRALMPSFRL